MVLVRFKHSLYTLALFHAEVVMDVVSKLTQHQNSQHQSQHLTWKHLSENLLKFWLISVCIRILRGIV